MARISSFYTCNRIFSFCIFCKLLNIMIKVEAAWIQRTWKVAQEFCFSMALYGYTKFLPHRSGATTFASTLINVLEHHGTLVTVMQQSLLFYKV